MRLFLPWRSRWRWCGDRLPSGSRVSRQWGRSSSPSLWRSLRCELARRRPDEDNDKRSARLVVVGEPAPYPVGDPPRMAIGFTVHNYGDQPIHDLCVEFPYTTADGNATWVSMRTVLGPHEEEDFDFVPASPAQTSEEPSLWFLDSTGARWRVQAASHEPERIWHYIPPSLPEEFSQTDCGPEGKAQGLQLAQPWARSRYPSLSSSAIERVAALPHLFAPHRNWCARLSRLPWPRLSRCCRRQGARLAHGLRR